MTIDRKKVMRQTEEAAARSGRFRYLKKNATTNLRIFEYQDKDGDGVFAQSMTEHRRVGQGGKGLGTCRKEVFGLPCAECKVNQIASDTGKDRPFQSRTRYVVNAMDINDERKECRLWVLPATVFDDLAELALNEEWADIFEPKKGVPIGIKKEGSGLDTEYTTLPGRKPYPVDKSILSQVVDPLDEIRDPGLESQCAEIGVAIEDIFEPDELEPIEKSEVKKSSKKATKKATKKASSLKPPAFGIGQAVQYKDEETICHVTAIDGDNCTIEDEDKEEFDVEMNDLTIVEEDDGFSVGDLVFFKKETNHCEITEILNDTEVTIQDANGDEFDVAIVDLMADEGGGDVSGAGDDDIPFEGGGKKAKNEDAPKCFGDPQLYDADDKECKACGYYDECGGNADLNKAGVGNVRKPAKKAGSSGIDDIVGDIIGKKKK